MTRKPVLIGVDESPASVWAAALGRQLAGALRAPYRLVHAFPDLWSVSGVAEFMALDTESLKPLVQDVGRQLKTYLEGALGEGDGVPVEVWFGRPGWVLAQAVERYGPELVVVGGKHHGMVARALGGSTAHYLARTLDVPLVVAGVATGRAPLRRVLAAVDLSPASKRTLDVAERMAQAVGAELRVLHAVEPFRFPMVAGLALDEDQFARRSQEEFESLVEALERKEPHNAVVRYARAADAVVEEAAQWLPDLVVVGSHGKGLVDRILLGSTTEELLNRLPASLLIVPIGEPKRPERSEGARPGKAKVHA